MSFSQLERIIPARAVSEGAGVTVHRTIGTTGLRNYDPFLMLDHFGSDNPNEYIAGFPDHPHRGFTTLTYMIDGHMMHRDSMGNQGNLLAGGAQWMKAASGVIHSEMPQQSEGLMRGFQLWINLPAHQKMSDPAYQEYSPSAIPQTSGHGYGVRILAGEFDGVTGPIVDKNVDLQYLDISLDRDSKIELPIKVSQRGFLYVFEGDGILIEQQPVTRHQLALLAVGSQLRLQGSPNGASRMIVVYGTPLDEPIVQYGPFVMNTSEEIEKALNDYRSGRLVTKKAAFTTR